MNQSKFVIRKVTDLNEVREGDEIPTSDFALLTDQNKFVQYEYITHESDKKINITPGVFNVTKRDGEITIEPTKFSSDKVLEEYVATAAITKKIDNFFQKLPVYERYQIFPKRGMLLHGKPGVGKSQSIAKISTTYANAGDTAVLLWSTSDFDSRHVKDLIKNLHYSTSVKKFILIAEDIGGGEYVGGKMAVKASLLSLLDNVESTFKIPTMILATTNYPENLLEALTNRPQRFDDVMEIKPPDGNSRAALVKFFAKDVTVSDEFTNSISQQKYDGLTVAHLKEIVIRSALYDLSLQDSLDQVHKQSEKAKRDFKAQGGTIGFGQNRFVEDDDY